MSTYPSVRMVRLASHKGVDKEWSNRYHFIGGIPADLTAWTTLVTNIRDAEVPIFPADIRFVRAVCYLNDESPATHVINLTGAGTITLGTKSYASSNSALWIRWETSRRDSRGHPIYARSYYHGALQDSPGSVDVPAGAQRTAMATYGAHWLSGFSDGGANTYTRSLPDGTPGGTVSVAQFIARRVMSRRG